MQWTEDQISFQFPGRGYKQLLISQRLGAEFVYIIGAPLSAFILSRIPPSLSSSCSSGSVLPFIRLQKWFIIRIFTALCCIMATVYLRLKVMKMGNSPHAGPFFQVSNTLQNLPAFVHCSQSLQDLYFLSIVYYLKEVQSIRHLHDVHINFRTRYDISVCLYTDLFVT